MDEPSGNKFLDAEEEGAFVLLIKNAGKGKAKGLYASLSMDDKDGLQFDPAPSLGEVDPQSEKTIRIDVRASVDVRSAPRVATFSFTEANGFGPSGQVVKFATRELRAPRLELEEEVGVDDASGNGRIEPGELVKITTRILNRGAGMAKMVTVKVKRGANVFIAEGSDSLFTIPEIRPNEYSDVSFSLYTNWQVSTPIPVNVDVDESYHKYGRQNVPLSLSLNKPIRTLRETVIRGIDDTGQHLYGGTSPAIDIEHNIPSTASKDSNAVALIFGIREYASSDIPRVEYAKRDAELVREYLVKVLGYNPRNILPQNPEELMTVGTMKSLVRQKLPAYLRPDGSSDLFVYYSGHGAPSTASRKPFLVPYDCDPNFVSDDNAYNMTDFYADIGRLKAQKKTVVIDACFSGQSGDGKAVVKYASPVLFKVDNVLSSSRDAIIFQSSESDQVSNWYPEKKHGMFTYFFLKGLKGEADLNKDSKITVGEMETFINDENRNLPYVSQREMQRKQRAVVTGQKESIIVGR